MMILHFQICKKLDKIISNSLISVQEVKTITMNKLLGITLAIVMLSGSVPLGFSEPLRVQLEAGIETNQLQCDNPNHVLVQRTSGNVACVSEKSAERMGWEIIKTDFPETNTKEITTISEMTISDSVNVTKHNGTKFNTLEVNEIITESEEENETEYFEIWNPIRDDKRDDVAELFASAINDSITGYDGQFKYDTENGFIIMNNEPAFGKLGNTIKYNLPITIYDADERREFVYSFMEKASFNHTNTKLVEKDQRRYVDFYFETDRSFIDFKFASHPYEGTTIKFLSWSNNPNPLPYPLTEKEALDKMFEYGQQTEFSYDKYQGEACEITLYDELESSRKIAFWGEPYYMTTIGYCEYPSRHGLEAYFLIIFIDGTRGEHIFSEFMGAEG